jgi:hypothetical protein
VFVGGMSLAMVLILRWHIIYANEHCQFFAIGCDVDVEDVFRTS